MSALTDLKSQAAQAACFNCLPADTAQAIKTYLLAVIAGGSLDPKTILGQARGFFAIPSGFLPAVQATLTATLAGSSVPDLVAQSGCATVCLTPADSLAIQLLSLAGKAGTSTDPKTLARLAACFVCIPFGRQASVQAFLMAVAAGVVPAPPAVPGGGTGPAPTGPPPTVPPSILKTAIKTAAYPPGIVQTILGDAIALWQSSFNVPTPTGFSFVLRADGSVIDVSWDPPPSGVTKTELWTSNDNVTFALEATIAAPGTTTTSAIPAAGFTKYGKIRWCNASVCGFFTAVQSVSSGAVGATVWSNEVVANGGPAPSVGTLSCVATFLDAIATIRSRIYHLNIVAPDSFNAFHSPLIHTNGVTPWVLHTVGAPPAENLTVNGYIGGINGANGSVYDTGVVPSGIASFNSGNCGISVYMSEATITGADTAAAGSFNTTTTTLQLRPRQSTGNQTAGFGWDASNPTNVAASNKGGFYMLSRVSTTNLQVYFSNSTTAWASLQTIAVANAQTPNAEKIAFAGCLNGAAYSSCALQRISFMAVHDGFNSADGKILADAVQALRVCLGGGFV